jgi:hypothetical protein
LLRELFAHRLSAPLLGYLGGSPEAELDLGRIRELMAGAVRVASPHEIHEPLEAYSGPPLLLVHASKRMPPGIDITFNVQLYHVGNAVRTGESSGSAHSGVSIPVVWEMNGAEAVEDLAVVKVPYTSRDAWRSADFSEGARLIAQSIRSGQFERDLDKNLGRARTMNPAWVAEQYIRLFPEVRRAEWVFH